jgi:hypothetical protein
MKIEREVERIENTILFDSQTKAWNERSIIGFLKPAFALNDKKTTYSIPVLMKNDEDE